MNISVKNFLVPQMLNGQKSVLEKEEINSSMGQK